MIDLVVQLTAYQRNAWPAMVEALAAELGVNPKSLTLLGLGWMPEEACWVFPERDAEGAVVGLVRRFKDGRKVSVKGGKRGLTYAISPDFTPGGEQYIPGSHNWLRVSKEAPCPLCGKPDWCLVSAENPSDPRAVLCCRVAEGARQSLGDAGYLHVRKPTGEVIASRTVLPPSDLPVLVVEGQTDVVAAHDLGYLAVGKPSASGGGAALATLLLGRDVAIIGENDAGAGRLGMEKTFETLKPKARSVVKLLPPDGVKDLRAWVRRGLTAKGLADAIETGGTTSAANLLESVAPLDIADRWLKERHWFEGRPTLRLYADSWYRFDGAKYARVNEKTFVRGDVYTFLRGKTYKKFTTKGEATIEPYDADAHKVSNIIDTLAMPCPVHRDAPCWLDEEPHPAPWDLVSFQNGILHLPDLVLAPPTPTFFTLTAMPYMWDDTATCPRWLAFLEEIFPGDPEKIALLQEWLGYNTVADTSQEKLMFFVGRPGAGKGTVIEVLRAILGPDHVASTSFDTLIGEFGLQPLIGKLAAILPDAHVTKRGDPTKALQVLKEISGRDSVAVNRKNKDFLCDHKLPCRFTISVNSMPELPDHERSLDRRLLLLHFGECFTGREDTRLKERLAAEAPGIAVWAIQGLLRLREQGFTLPVSSTPVIEEFRKQSSPITEFADENCLFGSDYQVSGMMLYDAYGQWCRDQGIVPGKKTGFVQRFCLLYPGCQMVRIGTGGSQFRGFQGVCLSDEATTRFVVGRR